MKNIQEREREREVNAGARGGDVRVWWISNLWLVRWWWSSFQQTSGSFRLYLCIETACIHRLTHTHPHSSLHRGRNYWSCPTLAPARLACVRYIQERDYLPFACIDQHHRRPAYYTLSHLRHHSFCFFFFFIFSCMYVVLYSFILAFHPLLVWCITYRPPAPSADESWSIWNEVRAVAE